tara:strand:+ start:34 stop:423 length:390 start_codon:yes stop_codon:yes gene_type:complete
MANTTTTVSDILAVPSNDATPSDALALTALAHEAETVEKQWKAFNRMVVRSDIDSKVSDKKCTAAFLKYVHFLRHLRSTLRAMPAGTTAKGGVTRQDVFLRYGGECDPNLGARVTASEARVRVKALLKG